MLNELSGFFLRAKAWQLFPLAVGLYILGQIIALAMSTRPERLLFAAVLMSGSILPFLLWFWAMGTFLTSVVKPGLRMPLAFFNFSLVYAALYLGLFITKVSDFGSWLVPLHLAAMFCMFYALYFVSKALVLAERERPSSFYDYSGPFFLLWFFPVGIWFVQPRVNRLYAETNRASVVA